MAGAESARGRRFEIRRQRLKELIDDRFGGRQVDFANRIGIAAPSVSRMLFLPGKPEKRNIGDDMVERILAHFRDLPIDWFDTPLTSGTQSSKPQAREGQRLYAVDNPQLSPETVNLCLRIQGLSSHWRAAVESIVAIGESALNEGRAPQKRRKRR